MSTSYSGPSAPGAVTARDIGVRRRGRTIGSPASAARRCFRSTSGRGRRSASGRGRSPAIISRPPALPIATTAIAPPRTRPKRAAKSASTRGSSARSAASASRRRGAGPPRRRRSGPPSWRPRCRNPPRAPCRRMISITSSSSRASLQPAPGSRRGGSRIAPPAQQAVERRRMARQVVGQRRRGAEHARRRGRAGAGLRWNSDSICTPAGSRARNASNRPNTVSGLRLAGQARPACAAASAVEQLARPLERSARTWPACPAAHRGDDPLAGWRSPSALQRRDSGFRPSSTPLKIELAAADSPRRRAAPARARTPRRSARAPGADAAAARRRSRAASAKPMKVAKRASSAGRLRQRVDLPVGDHLQPVLDAAQEAIGVGQFARRPGAATWPARGQRRAARPSVVGIAQRRVAPAPDQLQRLRQELDLADAAFARASRCGRRCAQRVAPAASAPPLCASIRRFIAWMSATAAKSRPRRQTKGRISSQECRAQREVAGHRARLDHGGAFPVLAHALVVGDGGAAARRRAASRRGRGAAADRCGRRSRRRRAPPSARTRSRAMPREHSPCASASVAPCILPPPGRRAA